MNYRRDAAFGAGLNHSNVSRQQPAGGFTPTRSRARTNFDFGEAGMHNNLGELEGILERERVKFKEVREKLEAEVDTERKKRIEFENKLIKLKDEFSKKDLLISELEFKNNNILHQNEDLTIENDKLRAEIERMEGLYGTRIAELEAELEDETKHFDETTSQYNSEFEKFKKEGTQYIETLTFEYDRKIKSLEQKLKASESSRKEIAFDNKKLNDTINMNKITYQEEIRNLSNRLKQEQQKKMTLMHRSHDQKLKSLEETKQALTRRLQQYMRLSQDKDRQIHEMQQATDQNVAKLRSDNSELHQKVSQMGFITEKLKNEIFEKQALLNRNTSEINHQIVNLKQEIEQKKKQIDAANKAVRQLRQNLKDSQAEFESQRTQLLERANYYEIQCRKYKDECTRICQTLKSKVNETITNVSYKR